MLRIAFVTVLAVWAPFAAPMPAHADEVQAPPAKTDAFFAGTIIEVAADRVTVARTVLGRTENRTFLRTPETRVEGRIAPNVRVTVRYTSDELGDTATMIIVRPPAPPPTQNKKK